MSVSHVLKASMERFMVSSGRRKVDGVKIIINKI